MTDESTSDEILMAAYQAGNPRAFRTLHDRHGASVDGFLVRRLGDRAAAEDLYPETFLRLHRARASWDPERPLRPWLFGIVHNSDQSVCCGCLRNNDIHDVYVVLV